MCFLFPQEGIRCGRGGDGAREHERGGEERDDDEGGEGGRRDGVDELVGSGSGYRVLQAGESSGRGDGPSGAPRDAPTSQVILNSLFLGCVAIEREQCSFISRFRFEKAGERGLFCWLSIVFEMIFISLGRCVHEIFCEVHLRLSLNY